MTVLACLKKNTKIINCNKIFIYNKYVHKSREPDKRSVPWDQARLQSPSGPFHVHTVAMKETSGRKTVTSSLTEISSDQQIFKTTRPVFLHPRIFSSWLKQSNCQGLLLLYPPPLPPPPFTPRDPIFPLALSPPGGGDGSWGQSTTGHVVNSYPI